MRLLIDTVPYLSYVQNMRNTLLKDHIARIVENKVTLFLRNALQFTPLEESVFYIITP